jgi:imidazolonepropionase-like amidohydrolase
MMITATPLRHGTGPFTESARGLPVICLLTLLWAAVPVAGQIAVQGDKIYTMAGPPISDGMIVVKDGKISALGSAADIRVPDGYRVLKAQVVLPGLVDAHTTVGLSGILNYDHDQDQLERSEPLQPELRAIDAYNAREELIAWVRSFGVTTIHTGHAPGELMSGQTMIAKTAGNTADEAALVASRAVAVTLSTEALKSGAKSPGTRGKMMALLRGEFIKARAYRDKQQRASQDGEQEPPPRDLRLETLARVLSGELALMVTAHRAQDISSALRLAREFQLPSLWLDGAAEAYLLVDPIREAGAGVILHPAMMRASGERENLSFTTAGRLVEAGVPVALQSGYEAYVPKSRVLLFEAAVAAAHGLSRERALATITVDAARLLGVDRRVGSLEVGKDGDLALYDGDPLEYTSHCVGVIIEGQVVSEQVR